jgi:hypothetical protein
MVRRTTIRKRMRAKLRQIKQQLRERMHDPVPQTGQWLKSVVQGYFNYYAVPGNLTSLGVFRNRVLALWWRTIRRRSQNTGSTGRALSFWASDGSLTRVRSIPFPTLASPPLIQDKNRMR